MDAGLRWDMQNGKTSVLMWGTNLSDKVYYRGAQDLVDLGVLLYYYAQPRRFGLTVEHKFGW